MKSDDKYDGILVCARKDEHHPLAGKVEAVDDNCRACGCDIMHQPLDKVELRLLPLCEKCGLMLAAMEEHEPDVIGLPGAIDQFDEIMGNGTGQAALDVAKKEIRKARAMLRE